MDFYIYLIVAYFLGGLPFGLAVGYMFGHGDIRKKGSGNIGSTNIWRIAGGKAATIVFVGDIGKGIAAVLLCQYYYTPQYPISFEAASLLAGFLAVLGHSFSPYLKFQGGKGVNTALGVFISVLPIQALTALSVFLLIVAVTRYVSLGSIVATLTLAVILWVEKYAMNQPVANSYLVSTTVVAVLILITHRQNIKRLIAGNENRFEFGRR
ncbi:MAG: glycerol-3-phosphate 1-O-acyltransferase PlsY [candidate division Zixibacteria bacterium]|nr:glycerol-3-phosphate 1-O-acyltransferase PlsY [candidate division Zixibacteria bacterium]